MNTKYIMRWASVVCGVGLMLAGLTTGCSLGSTVEIGASDSDRQIDPEFVQSRAGGTALYVFAVQQFKSAVSQLSWQVGLMTDELTNSLPTGLWVNGDARQIALTNGRSYGLQANDSYGQLQSARVTASQAVTILRALHDSTVNGTIASAYAIEGYSILLLAESFCSGIPLSQVPYDGDIVLGRSQTTMELLTIAVAKFDSSLAIPQDSTSIQTLARIGKGRAYLALGKYQQAAEAVQDVPRSDTFFLEYTTRIAPGKTYSDNAFWTTEGGTSAPKDRVVIVNQEGNNGMTWYQDPAHLDPRLPVTTIIRNGVPTFPSDVKQRKFVGGTLKFPLARGIEADMIRAEYAVQQGSAEWIIPINDARATVGLAALSDPENLKDRVDLLFQERAFWYYLEGVRLGDFRRLVRQYGRNPYLVYPTGVYTRSNGTIPMYGDAWVFGVPQAEYTNNYRYDGCRNYNP